jgi:hypothetical protein
VGAAAGGAGAHAGGRRRSGVGGLSRHSLELQRRLHGSGSAPPSMQNFIFLFICVFYFAYYVFFLLKMERLFFKIRATFKIPHAQLLLVSETRGFLTYGLVDF